MTCENVFRPIDQIERGSEGRKLHVEIYLYHGLPHRSAHLPSYVNDKAASTSFKVQEKLLFNNRSHICIIISWQINTA